MKRILCILFILLLCGCTTGYCRGKKVECWYMIDDKWIVECIDTDDSCSPYNYEMEKAKKRRYEQ